MRSLAHHAYAPVMPGTEVRRRGAPKPSDVPRPAGAPYPAAANFMSAEPQSAWWITVKPDGTRVLTSTTGNVLLQSLQELLRARVPANAETFDGQRVSGSDVRVDGRLGPITMKALWAAISALGRDRQFLDNVRNDAVAGHGASQMSMYAMIWTIASYLNPASVPSGTSFEMPNDSVRLAWNVQVPAGPLVGPTTRVLWQPSDEGPGYGTTDWVKPPSEGGGPDYPKPPTGGTPPAPVGIRYTPSTARDTTISPAILAGGALLLALTVGAVVVTNRSERGARRRRGSR